MLKLPVCLVLRNLKQTYINNGLTIEKKMKFSYQKLATHKETQEILFMKAHSYLSTVPLILFLSGWECFHNSLLVDEYVSRLLM